MDCDLCTPSPVPLSFPLIYTFSVLVFSTLFLFICFFFVAFLSSQYLIFTSPFLHLFSPPLPPVLPLFRLCKVQLGFGAFGLQAWRQEDALSEYALLGSLCVTLYFFALLF